MIRRPRVTNKYPYSNLFGLFLALKEFSKIRHYLLYICYFSLVIIAKMSS